MAFEPRGGFPPIIRIKKEDISSKTLETRGFVSSNIVSINDIMNQKKKTLFLAFGDKTEEDGIDFNVPEINLLVNKNKQ